MSGVCDAAKRALEDEYRKLDAARERRNCLDHGICPDCGKKLNERDVKPSFWRSDKWVAVCPTHGVMETGYYYTGP